jgi:wyosine [tRNA(Phe)-imidazoG37] synthetase (radical SAM superfamily)
MKYQLQNWNSKQRKEKMEEFNKKYHSEKHNRDMLIKQIKVETKTEYVKTLKQIDEAYPEIRRRQFSFKLKK